MRRATLLVLAVAALTLAFFATAEPVDRPAEIAPTSDGVWPQWRGPDRDASVASGETWPADLSSLQPGWRVELGPSYSGPIVGDDLVFTTETRDESSEVVSAYDRATGELRWSVEWEGSMDVPFFAKKNGDWIRSTPAYDGETLFVGGILEILVALDGDTGEERWRIDFPKRFGTEPPPFGFVCSPLVARGHVFVEAADSFFKLDAKTGDILWRSGPWSLEEGRDNDMMSAGSFSSPVLAEIGGREQLLVQTRLDLRGLDLETGEVLWTQPVPAFRGMNILTPTAWNDAIFTSSYRNGSYLYRLDESESGSTSSLAWKPSLIWENKSQAYMSSPLLVGDTVYQHLGSGRLTAIDLRTGEGLWTTTPFGKYWSLVRNGDRVLALDSGGELIYWRADPAEFQLVDRKEIADQSTWAHLAVAGDQIFVRELNALSVWRWGG